MSVLDLSLVKAPYGKGPRGPATINGWHFNIDPTSVQLPIRAKVQKYRTVGGFVVQVYGTTWGDLTVSGQFGSGGWKAQLGFLDRMVALARAQAIQRQAVMPGQNFAPSQPFRFTYPLLGWDFLCFLKAYTSPDGPLAVHMENTNINPKWTLTLFIVTDNGSLVTVAKNAYLQRLAPGLGVMWNSAPTTQPGGQSYEGYADDQYNSPLTNADVQNYVNSPTGKGSSGDVISATPSNLTGPDITPPPSGSTSSGNVNINNASDFAKALLAQLGATVTTVSTNLVRAWEFQEGMWSQAYIQSVSDKLTGGWAVWGAPAMNNPLNIGGWTGLPNGSKYTYTVGSNSYPVTVLNSSQTGATFSFNGNWANGVAATADAMQTTSNWVPIVTALSQSDPAAFFAAVGAWNPGVASSYSASVEAHYTSGDYVSAGY